MLEVRQLGKTYGEGDDAHGPGIQILRKALNGPPFAGRITALNENGHALVFLLHPALHFDQFDL